MTVSEAKLNTPTNPQDSSGEAVVTPVAKDHRDLRHREQLFPDCETFDTSEKGFVPFPIIYRKLFRFLSAPELRVFVYFCTRTSKYGISFPGVDEVTHDLALSSRRKWTPALQKLEEMRFVTTRVSGGKKFVLINHPRVAIEHLYQTKALSDDDLFEINEVLRELKQKPMKPSQKTPSKGA